VTSGSIAEAIDPDSTGFTGRARRAALARDLPALKQLAAEAIGQLAPGAASAPPPAALVRLARALEKVSAPDEAARLLRAAQSVYPGDVWMYLISGVKSDVHYRFQAVFALT
jgi:hypothetical protein